jgi:lysozyme family protein
MNREEIFKAALAFTLRAEGGYSDHAGDPGGETKYGISRRAFPGLDIDDLSRMDAARIYREHYWSGPNLDGLPAPLAMAAFDAGVNTGVRRTIRMLQKSLNTVRPDAPPLSVDGVIGPATLGAAGSLSGLELRLACQEFLLARAAFYTRLAALGARRTFLRGWLRRVLELKKRLDSLFFSGKNVPDRARRPDQPRQPAAR